MATNATDIAGNATDIAGNATDIAGNATDIAGNQSASDSNAGAISTNTGAISANTASTATNASGVDLNTEDLAERPIFWQARLSASAINSVTYTLPDGTAYTLDGTAAVAGDLVYDADAMLVIDLTGAYPQLLVNIDDAGTVACTLFNEEDDVVQDRKTASDGGNGYVGEWTAAGLSCSGGSCPDTFIIENRTGGDYVMTTWEGYRIVCVE
jgi:hypothetical protein